MNTFYGDCFIVIMIWECGGYTEKCLHLAIVLVAAESQQVHGNGAACMEGS